MEKIMYKTMDKSMIEVQFNLTVINPVHYQSLPNLLPRLAKLFSSFDNVQAIEIEPLSFDGTIYLLHDNQFHPWSKNKMIALPAGTINQLNQEKIKSLDEDPSHTRWRGSLRLPTKYHFTRFIKTICNQEAFVDGLIWRFIEDDNQLYRGLFSVTQDKDYSLHSSKLPIHSFALGSIVNGTTFCCHFHSRSMIDGSPQRISHDKPNLILSLCHTRKKMNLVFRVVEHESRDPIENERRWIEIQRFKLVYNYYSIKSVTVKQLADRRIELYFKVSHPPSVYVAKNDLLGHQDRASSHRKKIFAQKDYVNCVEEDKFGPFVRANNCSMISSDIIGRSDVLKFVLDERMLDEDTSFHLPLLALYVWRRYHQLDIDYANIGFFNIETKPDIDIPQASYEVRYALRCLQSHTFQFADNLHVNEKTATFLYTVTNGIRNKKNEELIIETLHRLAEALLDSGVFNVVLKLTSLYLEVMKDKDIHGNLWKATKNTQYLKRIFFTPTRTLCLPPHPFQMNRFLDMAEPEYALRLSIRDENFSSLSFAVARSDENDGDQSPSSGSSSPTKVDKMIQKMEQISRKYFGYSNLDPDEALRKVQQELEMYGKDTRDDFLNFCLKKRLLPSFEFCGRSYHFLGASMSQLRDHGMILYADDTKERSANDLRQSFGQVPFSEVAKYLSRVGLNFSQVLGFVDGFTELGVVFIDDIKGGRNPKTGNEYTFTEGIGKLSSGLARYIFDQLIAQNIVSWNKLDEERDSEMPSAYQIRFAGCKGMICIDPEPGDGLKIQIRKSMRKFHDLDLTKIGILKFSAPRRAYLNKPLITILNQIGLSDSFFMSLLLEAINRFLESFKNNRQASRTLETYCNLHKFVDHKKLVDYGYNILGDKFFKPQLDLLFHQGLEMIKEKARIPLDMNEARTMFGVVDETGSLEYGQIFVYPRQDPEKQSVDPRLDKPLIGKILVTKFPCMHPGDVKILEAVDVPGLRHIRDCIVFPAKGERPHPDEMAGSDLDGDEYCVIWSERFLSITTQEPANFPKSDDTPSVSYPSDYEIVDFYQTFIQDCSMGKIANAHLVWADKIGIFSPVCMSLAEKYSKALDFVKTGKSAGLSRNEKYKECPDFMEKWEEKPTYPSRRALGKMYRMTCMMEVALSEETFPLTPGESQIDQRLVHPKWKDYRQSALKAYDKYGAIISHLNRKFGFKSEMELFSNVREKSQNFREKELQLPKSSNYLDLFTATITNILINVMNKDFQDEFDHANGQDEDALNEAKMAKASAYYCLTQEKSKTLGKVFYGLPWIGRYCQYLFQMLNRNTTHLPQDHEDEARDLVPVEPNIMAFVERLQFNGTQISPDDLLDWFDAYLFSSPNQCSSVLANEIALSRLLNERATPYITELKLIEGPGKWILKVFKILQEKLFNRKSLGTQTYEDLSVLLTLLASQQHSIREQIDNSTAINIKDKQKFITRTFRVKIKANTVDALNFQPSLQQISGFDQMVLTPSKRKENNFSLSLYGSPLSLLIAQTLTANHNDDCDINQNYMFNRH